MKFQLPFYAEICLTNTHRLPKCQVPKCEKGCPDRLKTLPLVQVELETLLKNNITQIEKDITIQGFRSCVQSNCDGLESTTISDIGLYLHLSSFY